MEINSTKDAEALIEMRRIETKQKLERKVAQLYYVPGISFGTLLLYFGLTFIIDIRQLDYSAIILLLMNILVVGQAAMKRSDYIRDLAVLDDKK